MSFTIYLVAQSSNLVVIKTEKVFGGYNFTQDGKKLTIKQLTLAMKAYEPSCSLMKSSQKLYTTSIITACVGGLIIGSQLGRSIEGQSPKWRIVALGGGIALASIPLTKSSIKKAVNAVGLYNSSFRQSSSRQINKPELCLSLMGNVIEFEMKF
jgi:hypothetical protein